MLYEYYICLLNAYEFNLYGTSEGNNWMFQALDVEKKLLAEGAPKRLLDKVAKLAWEVCR